MTRAPAGTANAVTTHTRPTTQATDDTLTAAVVASPRPALAMVSPTASDTMPTNSSTLAGERSTSSSNSTIEAMNTSSAG